MLPSSDNDLSPFNSMFKRPSSSFLYDINPNYSFSQDDIHEPPLLFSNFSSPFFDEHELPSMNHEILSQPSSENHRINIPIIDRFATEQLKSMDMVTQLSSKYGLDLKRDQGSNSNPNRLDLKRDQGSNSSPNRKGISVRRKSILGAVPRKRMGKKDRHSKICTAQGIRDRRMRLSLQAARKFFDLQDLLGYDKASKTIEWLFDKSKNAIAKLAKDHPQTALHRMSISADAKSESLLSECEVVSGIKSNSKNDAKEMVSTSVYSTPDSNNITKETKPSQNNVVSKPNPTRESRERARARARCRTLQKMMIKSIDESSDRQGLKSNPNDSYLEPKIGSCSNSLLSEGADRYQETITLIQEKGFPQYCGVFEHEQSNDVGTLENLIGIKISSPSSPSPCSDIFHCSNAAVSGYPNTEYMGNWDMFNTDKMNNFQYDFTSTRASLAENPNSNHLATPDFL